MKVTLSTLLVGGALLGLLCYAYALPTIGNQVTNIIKETKMLEQVKAQEDAKENELADSDIPVFHKIHAVFYRLRDKYSHSFGDDQKFGDNAWNEFYHSRG